MERFVLILLLIATFFNVAINAKGKPDSVVEFKRDSGKAIFTKDSPYYSVLIESKESDDYDDHFEEFEIASKHFEEKVKFVFLNTDVEKNWETIEYLGLIAEDVPAILFIDLSKGLSKYKAEFNEITRKNIISFVQDCLDGKSVAFLKSEDVPRDWDSKPVKQLVGKNFEEVVFEQNKTAFVMFYAPWCTACQNTMPEIEKLAKLFAKNKHVIIARMDATTNEIPRLPILDVPTLALFIKGDTKPIYYTEDERTAEEFQRFINMKMKDAEKKAEKKPKKEKKEVANEEQEEKEQLKVEEIEETKKSKKNTKKSTEKKTTTKEGAKKKTKTTEEKSDKEETKSKKGTESKTETKEKTKQGKEEKKKSGKTVKDETEGKEEKSTEKKTKGKSEKSKKGTNKSKSGKTTKKDEL